MEKIYTFTTNKKSYVPNQTQILHDVLESDVNYSPTIIEKIISQGVKFALLSNLNKNLTTNSGTILTYGN